MEKLAFGFAGVVAGCAVGAAMPRITAQTFAPNPAAPRWEQTCIVTQESGPSDQSMWLASESNRMGSEGWERVGFTQLKSYQWLTTACFKRPAP